MRAPNRFGQSLQVDSVRACRVDLLTSISVSKRAILLVEAAIRSSAMPPTMKPHGRLNAASPRVVDILIPGKTTEGHLPH